MVASPWEVLPLALSPTLKTNLADLSWRIIMSKEQKGNRESKKPKQKSDGTKKQKKDPKRHDSPGT